MAMMRAATILLMTMVAAAVADNSTMSIMAGIVTPLPIPGNSTLVALPMNATVNPCANFICTNGTVCQIQTVNCLLPPCPPLPQCVAPTTGGGSNSTVDPCASMRCGNGTICKLTTVNCLLPPCPPLPQCVAPSTGGGSNITVNPCSNFTCTNGTVCQLQTVNCLLPPCPPLPQCVAPTTGGGSNSTVDPCASMSCGNGTICKVTTVNCLLPPCPPLPQCVTPSTGPSCMTMKCAANTTCIDLPTGSVCQPNGSSNSSVNACSNFTCSNGTVCQLQTVNCLLPPCPPLPQCVAPSTGGGSNSTVDPCASMRCGNGTICKLTTVNCLLPPCPPLPQCVAPSTGPSCMTMKCAANTTCVDLPTGSVCQPNGGSNSTSSPCASMLCAVGSVCQLQTVNCLVAPCPPLASCVPRTTNSSACLTMKCATGYECRNGDKGETCYPISSPHPDLCANHTCPSGQTCGVVMVNCLVAPCPPPQPRCGPPHGGNDSPCNAMECAAGFFCVVQHGEAECVHKSGASCAATSCPMNTTCIDFKDGAACLDARQPSSNLTCATIKCAANTTCMILPNGPTCLPNRGNNSPCNTMECAKGFFCIVQHGEPDCVPHSGASCAATSCPMNTTCIEFRDGATCMAGHISGGCANITCGGGARCKDTPEGPRCLSTGRRDDRVVDIYGCGRGEQFTQCRPQCEDTCRGIQTCDLSIPASSNATVWTNSTMGNSTNLPSQCVSGCICRDRFKRNVQGNCVPNNRCWLTPGCRENESWSGCRGCEKTCANPTGAGQMCATVCRSGCGCDEGYVRSKRGMCVLQEDCRTIDLINGDHGNRTIVIEG